MCGIAGFIGVGDEVILNNMVASINHRGPDYQGISMINNVGLAHARLSIIDLSPRSNQPIFTSDKKIGLVFNGEIYNYLELKEQLLKTNKYTFETSSDTEVILYAYAEYGIEMLKEIQGMFALAIYDYEKQSMLLAKDRMGKKPLYYNFSGNTFIFASELKALLKHPSVKKEMNYDALNQYLTFDYIPTPNSILNNVYKLEASHYMLVKNGKIIEKSPYWQIQFPVNNISYSEAKQKLDTLLDNAVKKRLISDVPLGVFLSGGLDSSTIAYYAQKNSNQKIKTFSIGFNETSYDERDYARLVSEKLGTEHYEEILTGRQALDLISVVLDKMDEPFADPSIIPTYFLSWYTKQHVTVALGGDGSDELLAGYPTFISEKVAGIFHKMPKMIIHFLDWVTNYLPASDQNISLDFKVKQFLKGFEGTRAYTHTLWLGSFTPKLKSKLLTQTVKRELKNKSGLECIDRYIKDVKYEPHFNQLLYAYYKTYLQDDILVKVDRASMYNSLEVRAPFLDTDVVEFLNSQPKSYKIKGYNVKRILKDIMKERLPIEIVNRQKKGFGIPVSLWLRNELKEMLHDTFNERDIKKQGIFEYKFINKLITDHQSGAKNHRKLLWNLLIFEMWYKRYLD